jgi:uncharacterized protein
MSDIRTSGEQSMDEILASIRRMIASEPPSKPLAPINPTFDPTVELHPSVPDDLLAELIETSPPLIDAVTPVPVHDAAPSMTAIGSPSSSPSNYDAISDKLARALASVTPAHDAPRDVPHAPAISDPAPTNVAFEPILEHSISSPVTQPIFAPLFGTPPVEQSRLKPFDLGQLRPVRQDSLHDVVSVNTPGSANTTSSIFTRQPLFTAPDNVVAAHAPVPLVAHTLPVDTERRAEPHIDAPAFIPTDLLIDDLVLPSETTHSAAHALEHTTPQDTAIFEMLTPETAHAVSDPEFAEIAAAPVPEAIAPETITAHEPIAPVTAPVIAQPEPAPVVAMPTAAAMPDIATPVVAAVLPVNDVPINAVPVNDDAVAALLQPMLRQWLDDNMPRIVEKALRNGLDGSKG